MKRFLARLPDLLGIVVAAILTIAWVASHQGTLTITIELPRAELELWNQATFGVAVLKLGPIGTRSYIRADVSREVYRYDAPYLYPHIKFAGIVFYRTRIYCGCIGMFRPIPPANITLTGVLVPIWIVTVCSYVFPTWSVLRRILRRRSRLARGFELAAT